MSDLKHLLIEKDEAPGIIREKLIKLHNMLINERSTLAEIDDPIEVPVEQTPNGVVIDPKPSAKKGRRRKRTPQPKE